MQNLSSAFRGLAPAAIALLCILANCRGESDKPDPDSSITYDSAGIEIVVSQEPAWASQPGWSVDPSPELVLGNELGPERFFFRVGGIVRFGDGRLIVENRGSQELFVFDSTGVLLATWGGRGEGPGEYSRMRLLTRCGGERLAVFEDWRVTLLDSVGSLQETVILPSSAIGNTKEIRGVGEDCGSVFVTELVPGYPPSGGVTSWYLVQGLWVSLGGSRVDTLGPFRGTEWIAGRSGRPEFLLPFAYTANWASDGNAIYYGWGDRPEIRLYSPEGPLLRVLRWFPPPDSITEADWADYRAAVQKEREMNPRMAAQYLPRDNHPRPDLKPYYGPPDAFGSAFVVGDEGFLWARESTQFLARDREAPPPSVRWRVFDRSGRWLGQVRTPEGFQVRAISGGRVLGVYRDSLGVEEVRSYRILGHEN